MWKGRSGSDRRWPVEQTETLCLLGITRGKKIAAIKAVRGICRLSLTQAKAIVDKVDFDGCEVPLVVRDGDMQDACDELAQAGCAFEASTGYPSPPGAEPIRKPEAAPSADKLDEIVSLLREIKTVLRGIERKL